MKAICDKCRSEFKVHLKVDKKGDVHKTHFICPHCDTDYPAGYTNSEIRRLQKELRKLRNGFVRAGREGNKSKFEKLERKYNEIKKIVSEKMDRLKDEVERRNV